jgi:hypothetical protein
MLSCRQIDDIVKMKRNKMKKIVALVAVLFSVVVPVQSQAADEKSLVIIDSYFDSRAVGANIVCAPTIDCSKTAKPSTSVSDTTNHGNAMIEIAKKQSSTIKIIALRSASTPTSDVNAGNFIEALKWVNSNASTVGAVSFSRFFNGTKTCSPHSANTANYGGVVEADTKIRSLISELKSKGIPVFIATGNKGKTAPVDYPACITDSASVTANNYTQATSDANTDYIGSLPSGVSNYIGTIIWNPSTKINPTGIPQTTSSATVATAAKWVITGGFVDKVVPVLP